MIDFFTDIGSGIMWPLYWATSAILTGWHRLFGQVLDPDAGYTWAPSIIGLTITIRFLLIPLFVKQIKSSRNMQLLQPKVKELQKKYGHDRERLGQETMKLYKDAGTNPFASCLPLLLQAPIFFALFRLLNNAAKGNKVVGLLTQAEVDSIQDATLFGAEISRTFIDWWSGDTTGNTGVLTVILVLAMTATTFLTQRQLFKKNMPASALTGQYAQTQKLMLYVLPVVFAVGGVAFPVGVILYWTTSNLWTMGQQFYVIRNNPAPGTPAFAAKQDRDRRKGKTVTEDPLQAAEEAEKPQIGPRQQPKKKPRSQRKPSSGKNHQSNQSKKKPGGSSSKKKPDSAA
ncbi:hypothetical protein BH24ACT12_BH24ACT12_09770 [soil metagenome]